MSVPMYPKVLELPIAQEGNRSEIGLVARAEGKASLREGFPPITSVPVRQGGKAPDRLDFNALFHMLSQHIFYMQSGGQYYWSEFVDYPVGCKITSEVTGRVYLCKKANGPEVDPDGTRNPDDPANREYWEVHSAPNSGMNTPKPLDISMFYSPTPPDGWKVCNGQVLLNIHTQYAYLYDALLNPKNSWMIKTMQEWERLSQKAGGVGGVGFCVFDEYTKMCKLPDLRGDSIKFIGTSLSEVGDWHNDAIRNIVGDLPYGRYGYEIKDNYTATGAFVYQQLWEDPINGYTYAIDHHKAKWYHALFGANRCPGINTADENRVRAIGWLPCIYVG